MTRYKRKSVPIDRLQDAASAGSGDQHMYDCRQPPMWRHQHYRRRAKNSQWDQELHDLNSGQLEEGPGPTEQLGTSRWNQDLSELGSEQVEEAPRQVRFADDLQNPMDADKHDVGLNPLDVAGLTETKPQLRQERRCQERR